MRIKFYALAIALMIAQQGFSQLEIIDKIAGTLIPGIANGIKDVLDRNRNKEKIKKEEVVTLQANINQQIKDAVSLVNNDAKNIDALNELFEVTGQLYDNIGSLKTLTNDKLLENILLTNSHNLMLETAIAFSANWKKIDKSAETLNKIAGDAPDANLRDEIKKKLVELKDKIQDLQTNVGLTKDVKLDMSASDAKSYVQNMDRSRDEIVDIEKVMTEINVVLSSRLTGFKKSLEELKEIELN